MFSKHRLAEVAALLADSGRAGMVTALWDGSARPAGELARIAGVSAATASVHLGRLVAGGVLRVEPRGRHRYFRLAGPDVAAALEALARVLPPHPGRAAFDAELPPLRRARLCYDHVAGRLGVALSDALLARGWLTLADGAFALRPAGRRGLARLPIDFEALEHGRRPLLRACLDWTERREHVGGSLGAALAMSLLERDWIRRRRGTRALLVTRAGQRGLADTFGLTLEEGALD
jgi:DNA-binding transcriptional ArsR family regulator